MYQNSPVTLIKLLCQNCVYGMSVLGNDITSPGLMGICSEMLD